MTHPDDDCVYWQGQPVGTIDEAGRLVFFSWAPAEAVESLSQEPAQRAAEIQGVACLS